jgi:hypothetical protein
VRGSGQGAITAAFKLTSTQVVEKVSELKDFWTDNEIAMEGKLEACPSLHYIIF